MYAIIKTGGKQYRVTVGRYYRFESLPGAAGETVVFDQVLAVVGGAKAEVGRPLCAGVKVKGVILSQGRGKKVKILHFKRRKHQMKHKGHRQNFTEIRITEIPGHEVYKEEKKKVAAKVEAAKAKPAVPAAKKTAAAKAKPAPAKKPAAAKKQPVAKTAAKASKPAAKKATKTTQSKASKE